MKVAILKRKSPPMKKFDESEWKHWNVDHFGKEIKWNKKRYFLKAYDGKEVLGTMDLKVEAGIGKIRTLIVKRSNLRQGVGRSLIKKAEKLAKKDKAHKLILNTGKDWEAVKFYQSLGFKKSADLPNHFFHVDFIELTKFI